MDIPEASLLKSHIDWKGERNMPYKKDVETFPLRTRFGGGMPLAKNKSVRGSSRFGDPKADNILKPVARGVSGLLHREYQK